MTWSFLLVVGSALAAGSAGFGLAELTPAELSVPATHVDARPVDIPVTGDAHLIGVQGGVRSYELPLPVRPRVMFLSSMPPGMEVRKGSRKLPFSLRGERAGTWGYSAHGLVIRVQKDAPRPRAEDYIVRWPDAQDRQDALDAPDDGTPGPTRALQVGTHTRTGILLPAPAHIAWQVDVPAGGVLRFDGGVVPAEVPAGPPSDGTTLLVTVAGEERARFRLTTRRFSPFEVDLTSEGGTTVRLELRVEDDETGGDYAFVTEPRIVVPTPTPQRVVFAFIDTLRRDHVGTYGAVRGATPTIDALGARGVVFEDARTVAPWTLPSARSVLTGMQPEYWSSSARIQGVLASRGWATAAYVGNVYLASGFDMAAGWGEHNAVNLPYGDYEVERGIDFIGRHPDEDAMVMVHFMDLHLPYKEVWPWRNRYVSSELPALGSVFNRSTLLNYAKGRGKKELVQTYLQERYDQNLAFVDHAIARLVDAAGPNAVVVIFSDHGEEFFDHGDLEHGHSLHDELLRVPLIVTAPGIAARRVDGPVSLLDITPTVLDLLGLGGADHDGLSLAGIMRGDPSASLADRPLAFGRLLYGPNAWGSLHGDQKWVSRGGDEVVFDLTRDPQEKDPNGYANRAPGRAALAAALKVPTTLVLRVVSTSGRGSGTVELTVPGGVASVWLGDEPTNHAKCKTSITANDPVDGAPPSDTVRMEFSTSGAAQREVYVLPKIDPLVAVRGAVLSIPGGPAQELVGRSPDVGSGPLAKVSRGARGYAATWAEIPAPFGDELTGFDPESAAALAALGYLDADHDNPGVEPGVEPGIEPADVER